MAVVAAKFRLQLLNGRQIVAVELRDVGCMILGCLHESRAFTWGDQHDHHWTATQPSRQEIPLKTAGLYKNQDKPPLPSSSLLLRINKVITLICRWQLSTFDLGALHKRSHFLLLVVI